MSINTYPIKIRQRGQLTIPQPVREQWSTQNGDVMTLVQFEDFAILAPTTLKTPALARQFSQMMDEEGVSLADLLAELAEERKKVTASLSKHQRNLSKIFAPSST